MIIANIDVNSPVIEKVANGNSLTVTELTSMDTKAEGDKIMNT